MNQKLVNEKQAAKYLGLSPSTLQSLRFMHKPPAYVKIGRSVRYLVEDLDEFLKSRRINPEK